MKAKKGTIRVLTGNYVAANAARLCRPEVVSCYPITPQSEVAEQMSAFVANGELDAEIVEVEGENSAMNVVCAASMAGARVFTATSSYGLVFMYDTLLQTSAYRAPVVMVNVNRETPGIHAVSAGQQDLISTRDSGWVQIIVENNQEIMDQVIMAYRLAEDINILLPVMVNYDGYYLSYLAKRRRFPTRKMLMVSLRRLKNSRRGLALSRANQSVSVPTVWKWATSKHAGSILKHWKGSKPKSMKSMLSSVITSGVPMGVRLKNIAVMMRNSSYLPQAVPPVLLKLSWT